MVVVGLIEQFTVLFARRLSASHKKLTNHIDDDDNKNMTRKHQPLRARRSTGRRTITFLLLLCLATLIRPTEAFFLTRIVVMVLASLSNLMGWSDSCPPVNGSDIICNHEHAPVLCEFRCVYDNKCIAAKAGYDGGCIG
jgi:hypothetical protein